MLPWEHMQNNQFHRCIMLLGVYSMIVVIAYQKARGMWPANGDSVWFVLEGLLQVQYVALT
jgi:hypothetical protein